MTNSTMKFNEHTETAAHALQTAWRVASKYGDDHKDRWTAWTSVMNQIEGMQQFGIYSAMGDEFLNDMQDLWAVAFERRWSPKQ